MNEQWLDAQGIYFRTNDFRAGRQTLVFVHGVSGSCSAWRAYESRFEHDFNVLSYDLRGHGRSHKYRRCADYAIPHFVDDLRALLRHLRIDACILVAHSFATLIALEFLRTEQARVDGVVLISPDFDVERRMAARILRAALTPLTLLERFPFRPRKGRHVDYSRYVNSGDWNIARMREDIANTTWRVYWYCTIASYSVHAGPFLSEIRVPVLLVHGGKDTIFPLENSVYMAARIRFVDLVVIDDANHIVVLNQPHAVSEAIEQFARHLPHPDSSAPAFLRRTQPSATMERPTV
jgi:pimeloyl-ACP methyl ester carboxylesterase